MSNTLISTNVFSRKSTLLFRSRKTQKQDINIDFRNIIAHKQTIRTVRTHQQMQKRINFAPDRKDAGYVL